MEPFTVSFAGSTVTIFANTAEALDFLSLLFENVAQQTTSGEHQRQLFLLYEKRSKEYQLNDGDTLLYGGALGVKFAAHIYDTVIFHLLNKARNGIALHAGGVVCRDRVIILPGQSGSGKSTLTAWLAHHKCSYLTDELIFISIHDPLEIQYFRRPLCLKPGSLQILEQLLSTLQAKEILIDRHGAVIPHRLLNPEYREPRSPPALVILPRYCPGAKPECETLSKARLATLLMGCHVNARNLIDHGFKQVLEIARSTPAYRLRYSELRETRHLLKELLDI